MTTVYHPTQLPETSGIYRILCTITGKQYIGSSINLRSRWNDHRSQLRRDAHPNQLLQYAWNKYGSDAFIFEVIELVLIPFLLEREQYWLDKIKPFAPRKGFNIARSAQAFHLGLTHTPEAIAKMSAARLGKPSTNLGKKASPATLEKQRLSHLEQVPYNYGKKLSLEHCEKLRIAKLGKPGNRLGYKASPETRAKNSDASAKRGKTFIVTAPDGSECIVYGLARFCREHNLSSSKLIQVAKGNRKQYKGWEAHYPEME